MSFVRLLRPILLIGLLLVTPLNAQAHSGRTDSRGGHNCNVGSCAGTYHYHNGGSSPGSSGGSSSSAPAPAATVAPSTVPPAYVAPPQPVISYKTVEKESEIPFNEVELIDTGLTKGVERVEQEGVVGVKTTLYKVTLSDGVETSRVESGSETTREPKDQIVMVGTKEVAALEESKEVASPEVLGIVKQETKPDEPESALVGFVSLGILFYGSYWLTKKLIRLVK